jgi:flagellar basal body-associated protein FliL
LSEDLKKQEQVQDQVIDDWDSLPIDPAMDDWDQPQATKEPEADDFENNFQPDNMVKSGENIEEKGIDDKEENNLEKISTESLESIDQNTAIDSIEIDNIEGEKKADHSGESLENPDQENMENDDDDFDQDFEAPESVEIDELDSEEKAVKDEKSLEEDSGTVEEKVAVQPDKGKPEDTKSLKEKGSPDSTSSSSSKLPVPPVEGEDLDPNRANFLKSLLDGNDVVPQKVELDLDGIFDGAKKEAETISPDATRTPVEAPKEEPLKVEDEKPDVEPLAAPVIRKVPKFKLFLLIGILFLGVGGLGFGIYRIFFKSPPVTPSSAPFAVEDDLIEEADPEPGEVTLERFFINLGSGNQAVTVEMEIILHYRDKLDSQIIGAEVVLIRDMIYRLTKAVGVEILSKTEVRRKLQSDLLGVLNNLDPFKGDPDNPRLTYVQISLLRRR